MDKSHTVAQLVRALLANSKVPGSSPGGVIDDFFFLSYLACKCGVSERKEQYVACGLKFPNNKTGRVMKQHNDRCAKS